MEALNKSAPYTTIVILLIVSIGVYLNTLPNEFVYDDEFQVLRNLWIKDIRNIPEIFLTNVWAFAGKENLSNYYRPLMHIIYMIDYHIFGLKPWGFHLTNIIFHAGVTLLVYLIASILINQSQDLNFKFHPEQVGTNSKSNILNPKSKIINLKSEQAVEKVSKHITCHSEQSEESHFLKVLRPFTEPVLSEILQSLRSFRPALSEKLRFFTSFRMTSEGMTESEGFRVTRKEFFIGDPVTVTPV